MMITAGSESASEKKTALNVALLAVKLVSLIAIPAETIVGATIPFVIKRCTASPHAMSFAIAAAAGVFMGAGCCHLLSDASEFLYGLELHNFPLPFFLMVVGFCIPLFLDKVVVAWLFHTHDDASGGHSHSHHRVL